MIDIDPTAGLTFDESTHSYTYYGEPVDSVTQVLSKYKPGFDAEEHSLRIAEGNTSRAAEIRGEWDRKRDVACVVGDFVHAEAERVGWEVQMLGTLTYVPHPGPQELAGKIQAVYNWYADHVEVFGGWVCPELKVVHPEYRIAGTVDLVASNYQGGPAVVDWKTSESIDLIGPYRNLLAPFTRGRLKLPDLNYWTYALQISMYSKVLRDVYSFEAENHVIVHLKSDGSYTEYEVPYLDEHVNKILEMR